MKARTAIIGLLVVMAVATLLVIAFVMYRVAAGFAAPRRNSEVMYDTKFGRTLCAVRHVSDCGVTLSECADTNIYACLHDVRWEDISPQ